MLPLLAVLLLSLASNSAHHPQTLHYRHFASRVCHYSIDYPAGWKSISIKKSWADTFYKKGSFTEGSVSCVPVQRLTTASGANLLRKGLASSGYSLSDTKISHGLATFSATNPHAQQGSKKFPAILAVSMSVTAGHMWIFAFRDDQRQFKADTGIYRHMLKSWHWG